MSLVILIPFFVFLLFSVIWLTYGSLLILNDYSDGFLWAICLFISISLCYFVLLLLLCGVLCWINYSCRLIRISDNGIVVGWIKKDIYDWEQVTGLGLSTLYPASKLYPTAITNNDKIRIYIAKGPFNKQEIIKRGISGVWDLYMLKKHPTILRMVNWFKGKLGLKQLADFEAPEGFLWMPYSDEIYHFLQQKLSCYEKAKQQCCNTNVYD